MTHKDPMTTLYASLSQRWMPEYVVKTILEVNPGLSAAERATLDKAVPRWVKSSMPSTFAQADDLRKQIGVAEKLFQIEGPDPRLPHQVSAFIEDLRSLLSIEDTDSTPIGGLDFKAQRLNREERRAARRVSSTSTLCRGHRAYNKRFRLLLRLEEKFLAWQRVANLRDLAQIAKSRLATRITEADFSSDVDTACFLAYYTAKLNTRSLFTFGAQPRAFDEIADLLFRRLGAQANWLAVAHIYPQPGVLAHLTEHERGYLLGAWFDVMRRAAVVLKEQADKGGLNLDTLIVRRGNDSSTWNEAAGAFNKAREGWINTLYALNAAALLDAFAPGKALRLMAADVAAGHRLFGSGLEPDTKVWQELPAPWEVVLDESHCDRALIEGACARAGIEGKGWIAPRPKTVVAWTPTPELVHGVIVSSPALAATLKANGYFGGPSKANNVTGVTVPIKREMLDNLTVKASWDEDTFEALDE